MSQPHTPPPTPGPGAGGGKARTRVQNRQARNARLQADFARLWTDAPRPRLLSREQVVAELAARYHLAPATVEDIVYHTPAAPPPAPAGPASVPELVQGVRQALAVLVQRLAELEAKLGEKA